MQGTYIIGEIGQNHNGSVDIAKLLVDLVSRPVFEDLFQIDLEPVNAIKLTKRDLTKELSKSMMNEPYNSINSFGKTYGEHREVLELRDEEHFEVYKHAKNKGLEVVETLTAQNNIGLLKYFTPDYLKVASRDLTNLPLLEVMGETKIPIILSTGMGGKRELDDALVTISKYHENISILHCVSEYPTFPTNANLNTILYLIENYGKYNIGYSDHTIGISAPVAAVALGAKIIEKHITIDRGMKGTDQINSLGPDGVNRMVRDIRLTELELGKKELFIDPAVASTRRKLERSIASNKFLGKGTKIALTDIHLLSPGDGIKWKDKEILIGKTLKKDIEENEIIYKDYYE